MRLSIHKRKSPSRLSIVRARQRQNTGLGGEPLELHTTPESLAALLAQRCYRDAEFRAQLAADPRGTIESVSGEKLAEDINLIVCQNNANTWHVPVPKVASEEAMSEEQLEQISAGEVAGLVLFVAGGIALGTVTVAGILAATLAPRD